jgi:spermidine synthase
MVPLVPAAGGPGAVLIAAAAAALGGALLALSDEPRGRPHLAVALAGAAAALGMVAFLLGPARAGTAFRIQQGSKFLNESAVEFERWNSFSRVTVSRGEADHKWIHIDADAATRMYSGEIAGGGYAAPRRFSESLVAGMVYALRKEGPALIIGPGGGPDVISALRAGVPRIVGVEVNPLIADTIMRGAYAAWSGDLYRRPGIEVHVDDGRSFVRRSAERYSSIQATLVDTWAASAAGAFTLSENNLYTAEAFVDYLQHLQPGGVLSMTRWYGRPPTEFFRLVSLGREALSRLGVAEAQHAEHFYVAADNRMATMLLKRSPYTSQEMAALEAEARDSRLAVLYRPFGAPGGDASLARYLRAGTQAFYASLPLDLAPVTDNRPFFFYTLRGRDFLSVLGRVAQLEKNNLGLAVLQLVLLVSVGLTLLLVVLPLAAFRREALRQDRRRKLKVLGYFLCLGLGFILVELGLMQRFILFLGHPIYALGVVLATLLGSSGLGSSLSPGLRDRYGIPGAIGRVVAVLGAALLIYAAGLGPLFQLLLGLPLALRIGICVLLVGALGTLMGMLLPLGVSAANALGADMVPWAWGLNGATSVVGSTLSLMLSMHFGFTATLSCGLAAYLFGAWLMQVSPWWLPRSAAARPAPRGETLLEAPSQPRTRSP